MLAPRVYYIGEIYFITDEWILTGLLILVLQGHEESMSGLAQKTGEMCVRMCIVYLVPRSGIETVSVDS